MGEHNKWGTSNVKGYSEAEHGPVYGANAHIRKRIDYSYHTNYTEERQQWQDKVIQLRCHYMQEHSCQPFLPFCRSVRLSYAACDASSVFLRLWRC